MLEGLTPVQRLYAEWCGCDGLWSLRFVPGMTGAGKREGRICEEVAQTKGACLADIECKLRLAHRISDFVDEHGRIGPLLASAVADWDMLSGRDADRRPTGRSNGDDKAGRIMERVRALAAIAAREPDLDMSGYGGAFETILSEWVELPGGVGSSPESGPLGAAA